MKVLGLDLSTHSGWAVVEDGKLIDYGRIDAGGINFNNVATDFTLLSQAVATQSALNEVINTHNPDRICVEQTNGGSFRTSIKTLEFTHALFLLSFYPPEATAQKIVYADTSEWRKAMGIKMTKEQRIHNKAVKAGKIRGKITPKHLAVNFVNERFGLKMKLCENDMCEAILLGLYGEIKKVAKAENMNNNFEEMFN